jgi:hypothetical protein
VTTTAAADRGAAEASRLRVGRVAIERWLLPVALLATFAAQARTLTFFFYQDDYVPFGEIATNGAWEYVSRLFAANDLTPNWRVIPGMLYLLNYELFGMSPMPLHIVMLAFHLGTVALIFRAVVRVSGFRSAAFAAGLVFGLQPSYAGALGQVAVLPHIAGAFFLAATLNAVIETTRAETPRSSNAWLSAAVGMYVLALMSNESVAAVFPAFALAFLLFDTGGDGRFMRAALRSLPFAALAAIVLLAVRTCDCTEASSVYSVDNAPRAFLIYMGRLVYPIGLEPPTSIDAPHLIAATALLAVSGAMLVRGPAIGRVGAAWMVLAIVPHIFIETHTATRFTYMPTAGFALLVAGCVIALEPMLSRGGAMAPAIVGVAAVVAIAPWYAVETHRQNDAYRDTTENWRLLHDEVERVFPDVPPGARVEIIGGPLVHPLDDFYVMPALGYTIWSPGVTLQTFAVDDPYAATLRGSSNPYVGEFEGRVLVPVRR